MRLAPKGDQVAAQQNREAVRLHSSRGGGVDSASFYDDIAKYYDLIYADWERSMRRHGEAISAMLGPEDPGRTRVLDVSAGIGTQSLPLSAL